MANIFNAYADYYVEDDLDKYEDRQLFSSKVSAVPLQASLLAFEQRKSIYTAPAAAASFFVEPDEEMALGDDSQQEPLLEEGETSQLLSASNLAQTSEAASRDATLKTADQWVLGKSRTKQSKSKNRRFTFIGDAARPGVPVHIKWRDICLYKNVGTFFKPKELAILTNVTGDVRPKEVVAIASYGEEKTDLLKVLTGRITNAKLSGSVRINGAPRQKNWLRMSGFIDVNSMLYERSTVRESLMFAAELKLPKELSHKERVERVNDVMSAIGISHLADHLVGNVGAPNSLSADERKRVSIGIELVTDPQLLFLDEPLKYLDSYASCRMVRDLKGLAAGDNRTIIMTISQASGETLKLFSRILLMASGEAIFYGTYDEIIAHLRSFGFEVPQPHKSIVEIMQEIVNTQGRDTVFPKSLLGNINESACSSVLEREPIRESKPEWTASWIKELKCHLVRHYYDQRRNYVVTLWELAFRMFYILLFSLIFYDLPNTVDPVGAREALLFYTSSVLLAMTSFTGPDSFALRSNLMQHERYSAMYRVSSFYSAKLISLIPLRLLMMVLYTFPIYYLSGLRTDGFQHFVTFLGVYTLASFAMTSLTLLSSAIHDNIAYILITYSNLMSKARHPYR